MLTGTLVTIVGFVPVGFAASSAGEYCYTLFAVVGIALTASWLVAVLFTPLTGVFILPDKMKGLGHEPSRFARAFHTALDRVLHLKYWVIGGTVALFVAALVGMQFVQQQFFPSSDRPELLVDLTFPQGSSINASWNGTYFSNDHQLVADSDARALGQALLRAADDVRKRDPRKSYDNYPCLPLVAALADFGCSGRFRIG